MNEVKLALFRAALLIGLVGVCFPIAAWLDRWATRPATKRPNHAPKGALTPLANAIKLIGKRAALPGGADRLLMFVTAPVAVTACLFALATVPFCPPMITGSGPLFLDVFAGQGTLSLLLGLYWTGALGIIAIGYAGANALALLGGLRVFLVRGLALVTATAAMLGVAFILRSDDLEALTMSQAGPLVGPLPSYGVFLNPVGFVCTIWAFAIASVRVERSRRSEFTDLISPFAAEAAGPYLFAHRLFETVELVTAAAVVSLVFLGGWTIPGDDRAVFDASEVTVRGLIFFAKWLVALILILSVRRSLPPVRHDDALSTLIKIAFVAGAASIVSGVLSGL